VRKAQWKVLSLVRKVSYRINIVWICGNHDGSAEVVSHLLGVTVEEEFVLASGGQCILVLHGHVFDAFIDAHPVVSFLAGCAYGLLQRLDRTHSIARWAKHGSKTFLRCARAVQQKSVEYARRKGCTAVCCGHTHAAAAERRAPVAYFNSGCWTELLCTYLTLADGIISLHAFEPEAPAERVGDRREESPAM
jgi:UDP-2,3-diacylglucosamine pyrophosphatase LpxH